MKNNIKPKEKVLVLAKRYESTDREKAAMEAIRARRSEIPQIRIKVTPTGTGANNLSPDHPNPAYGHVLLMDAFATEDDDFTGEVVAHSPAKEEIYRQLLKTTGQNIAIEYAGALPQDLAAMFNL